MRSPFFKLHTASHKLYARRPNPVNITTLPQQNIELIHRLYAVVGAPAHLGRLGGSVSSSGFCGKGITACNSIIRFTVSTIPGKASISQFAPSAIARYLCASSISYFARLMCWASWSRHASMICCNSFFGFLESSRNSKEGNAGTWFKGLALDAMRTVLSGHYACQVPGLPEICNFSYPPTHVERSTRVNVPQRQEDGAAMASVATLLRPPVGLQDSGFSRPREPEAGRPITSAHHARINTRRADSEQRTKTHISSVELTERRNLHVQ